MTMAEEEEKVLTLSLAECWKVPRVKRVPKAISLIRSHVMRHMGAEDKNVWIDPRVNEYLWSRGREKPPRKIKVKVIKFEDELVEVSLPEA